MKTPRVIPGINVKENLRQRFRVRSHFLPIAQKHILIFFNMLDTKRAMQNDEKSKQWNWTPDATDDKKHTMTMPRVIIYERMLNRMKN